MVRGKKTTLNDSKQSFVKRLTITFIVCILIFTTTLFLLDKFMNSVPMDKTENGKDVDIATLQNGPFDFSDVHSTLISGEGVFAAALKDIKRDNFLLIGNTDEGLSDTIMLFSYDYESKLIDIISLPRDAYYPREGYTGSYNKLNAVFHDGPLATAQAVHEILLGIPINNYFVIDYNGIEAIIDAIGGVPMLVEENMHYVSVPQDLYIDIPAGEQILDGKHAVQFLRFRKDGKGDLGRIERQQAFVKSAATQALKGDLFSIAKTVMENVDSKISVKQLFFYSMAMVKVDTNNIRSHVIISEETYIDGLSFTLLPNPDVLEQQLRDIYQQSEIQE